MMSCRIVTLSIILHYTAFPRLSTSSFIKITNDAQPVSRSISSFLTLSPPLPEHTFNQVIFSTTLMNFQLKHICSFGSVLKNVYNK